MELTPFFSILLSVHNGQRYLIDAIDSVLNQTFLKFELLVFDDGSKDETSEILRSYSDNRIKIFTSERCIGLTKALNFLLKNAQGKYVVRLDADDIMHHDRLSVFFEVIGDKEDLFIYSNYISIDSCGSILNKSNLEGVNLVRRMRAGINPICHGSICFRKNELVGYNEKFRYSQDIVFYFEHLSKFKIIFIPSHLYFLRINEESISFTKSYGQLRVKLYLFVKYFGDIVVTYFLYSILRKAYYTLMIGLFDKSQVYNRHVRGKLKS